MRWGAGACDFAVDPRLDGARADIHWLPAVDPRVVRLLADPTGSATLTLTPETDRAAVDGRYLRLGSHLDPVAAILLPGATPAQALAAIVPLDPEVPLHVEGLLRLWRRLRGHPTTAPPDELTPIRRKRLVQSLRAVDARRAGANRREIAEVLFGSETVPDGVAFDDHHLRSRTSRLIRDGLAMIAGGYRKLLKD